MKNPVPLVDYARSRQLSLRTFVGRRVRVLTPVQSRLWWKGPVTIPAGALGRIEWAGSKFLSVCRHGSSHRFRVAAVYVELVEPVGAKP